MYSRLKNEKTLSQNSIDLHNICARVFLKGKNRMKV